MAPLVARRARRLEMRLIPGRSGLSFSKDKLFIFCPSQNDKHTSCSQSTTCGPDLGAITGLDPGAKLLLQVCADTCEEGTLDRELRTLVGAGGGRGSRGGGACWG